jgi:hypothetical protein
VPRAAQGSTANGLRFEPHEPAQPQDLRSKLARLERFAGLWPSAWIRLAANAGG